MWHHRNTRHSIFAGERNRTRPFCVSLAL